ncbi:long-chain acyl-CoA synthetase [Rhizobiales bacterium GAS188]|nr:long-chain acyl-CoA synthetase [Rhizobiales bacterium GAS188]
MGFDAPRPWVDAFPQAARWDASIEVGTLPELIEAALAEWPTRPAISYRDTRLDYAKLASLSSQLATGLAEAGIGKGDAVALYLPNTPYHPIAFFAITRLGARVVHLSALDAPRELAHKLKDSGARTLITTNFAFLLTNALSLQAEGRVERVFVGDDAHWGSSNAVAVPWRQGVSPLLDLFRQPARSDFPKVSADDVAVLQYTGGTTGLPKGAMLTHGNLTAAVSMYRNFTEAGATKPGQERVICVLPLFHIYALSTVLLRNLRDGNELLLHPRFDAETVIADIETKRATVMPGVPTMWIAIANLPGIEKRDLSSLKHCGSGGAPMPFEVEKQLERMLGRRMSGGWGMTETSPAGCRMVLSEPSSPGLIGIPYPGIDMRIVALDDPRRPLPPNEVGEIAIRGANVFKGYWNQPEATAEAFADGYFLTGDIGRMDEKGQFTIVDRKKNMIISSGFNVYPVAIESAIYEHQDVKEVIVIGVPDSYRGQAAKAFVTLKAGAPPFTLDELRAFLADRLGRHEMPAALEIRSELPRSPAGKLLAKVLIDEETAKAAGEAAA